MVARENVTYKFSDVQCSLEITMERIRKEDWADAVAHVIKIQAWLEINHDSEKDIFSFKTREDRLKDLFSDFNSVQDEIEFLDDSQESDRALFEENYFATLSKIQNSIKSLEITNTGSATKQMSVKLPEISINKFSGHFRILTKRLPIPGDIFLADDSFHKPSQIDILVGSDLYYDLILPEIIPLGPRLPILQASHLGYLIAGVIAPHLTAPTVANNVSGEVALLSTCSTDELLTKFWNMEELSQKPILSEADELAEQIFQTTTKILENGRFEVDIPLKSTQEHQLLGDSFSIAKRRFLSLENKFQKDKKLFFEYKNFIDTYISSGHAEYVPLSFVNENSDKKYFIPHLCVINEQNKSTTLRVVMDPSCKSSTGKSLNDISLKGYQVQPDLFDILVRFRQYKFIFSCDIQKMFRQTWINKDQRFLQNILWRDDTHDSIKCIQLNTVTYGTNSAPFLATRVLQEISNKNKIQFPLASHFLEIQFYVDDGLCGSNNIEELLEILQQLNSVLNRHGFTLHKFHSNSSIFLQKINPKHSKNTTQEYDLNFDSTSSKVLGLKWNPAEDQITISVPENNFCPPVTKRKILSALAQCFDPLGLINPFIVKGKMLMQKLYLQKIHWDTEISDKNILNDWNKFLQDLSQLKN
ncbi:uncharacterized protein [Diabrotica undecimpunctata]|uniref:uncharacterized protein n=1 Tax=Diabrotica undecimpunctata TaxID=50387 RepID=UPI003B63216D